MEETEAAIFIINLTFLSIPLASLFRFTLPRFLSLQHLTSNQFREEKQSVILQVM